MGPLVPASDPAVGARAMAVERPDTLFIRNTTT